MVNNGKLRPQRILELLLNIPACEYRESGKMETAIPAKWKPVIGAPIM